MKLTAEQQAEIRAKNYALKPVRYDGVLVGYRAYTRRGGLFAAQTFARYFWIRGTK